MTRNRIRTLGLCLGLASSLFAVIQMDALASWMQLSAGSALNSAVEDFDMWIVPEGGVSLNKNPPAILADGSVSPSVASFFTSRRDCVCQGMIVVVISLGARRIALIGDSRLTSRHADTRGLDRDQVSALQRILGFSLIDSPAQRTVSPDSARLSLDDLRRFLGTGAGFSWLLCHGTIPSLKRAAKELGIPVTDSPVLRNSGSVDGKAIAILLSGHQSRFDPFTFRTKFSALMLHETTTTIFGMLSRAAFIAGLGFCISSFVYQLRERRAEMGCYAALGLTSEVIRLFLAESLFITFASSLVASLVSAMVMAKILPPAVFWDAYWEGVLLSSVYLPIVVVLGTLVPAQAVIEESPVRLVRG